MKFQVVQYIGYRTENDKTVEVETTDLQLSYAFLFFIHFVTKKVAKSKPQELCK
jgi:hypothetical protein